jgi:chlorite dismutase
MNERLFAFVGGDTGAWRVTGMHVVSGEPLLSVKSITVLNGPAALIPEAIWTLHGVTSNDRYVQKDEKRSLVSIQEGLGRPNATHAALIPIRKNAAWWLLAQNERREILEERSHHIQIGMIYLPAIARRLFHCRDTAMNEPFDFLTWFEYSPADTSRFEDLVAQLRATYEWTYVDREIDIRLIGEHN